MIEVITSQVGISFLILSVLDSCFSTLVEVRSRNFGLCLDLDSKFEQVFLRNSSHFLKFAFWLRLESFSACASQRSVTVKPDFLTLFSVE